MFVLKTERDVLLRFTGGSAEGAIARIVESRREYNDWPKFMELWEDDLCVARFVRQPLPAVTPPISAVVLITPDRVAVLTGLPV